LHNLSQLPLKDAFALDNRPEWRENAAIMTEIDHRQDKLLSFLSGKGFASLQEMTDFLQVSESTIRRDLDALEERGVARRTRGGAVFLAEAPQELAFAYRHASSLVEKQAIARLASELIEDGETVILDGGTTTYELAKLLVGRPLQIVTNSVPIASLFASRLESELIMLGGYLYPRTGDAVGQMTIQALGQIHANKAFVGVDGVTSDGFFNFNMSLVEVKRQVLKCADQKIILADSSKFGRRALSQLARLNEVGMVISDSALDEQFRGMILEHGLTLKIAELKPAESNGVAR